MINHILPTGGNAKCYSGVSVDTFIKKPTVIHIRKRDYNKFVKHKILIAQYEGFYGHKKSLEIRTK